MILESKECTGYLYEESFRKIKTNIKYLKGTNKCKVITVSSVDEGEGKTNISINLAISFSNDMKKVLLLEGNIRNSSIREKLNIASSNGLIDIIKKGISIEKAIYRYNDNLDVIHVGNNDDVNGDILTNPKLEEVFKEIREKYEYIIVDTVSLGNLYDAEVFGKMSDGIILVAQYNKTKKKKLLESIKILDRCNINLLGIIINKGNTRNGKK